MYAVMNISSFLIRQSTEQHLFTLQINYLKMDQELLESISIALNKLQQDQKVLSNEIIKLTEVCRNKFNKVEREQAAKNAVYET